MIKPINLLREINCLIPSENNIKKNGKVLRRYVLAMYPENNPPSKAEKAKLEIISQSTIPDLWYFFFNQKNDRVMKNKINRIVQNKEKFGKRLYFSCNKS